MEEILRQILEENKKIVEENKKLVEGQVIINNKLDKMEADIAAIKKDMKRVNGKTDMIIDTTADVKENITEINTILIDNGLKVK